jgi:transcriptional regulator with XRE-family HTH domain
VQSVDKTEASLKKLGANIRRERMARRMTQAKLAELVDVNIRTIQKIEAGHINTLVTTAMRIQKALGSPWDKLMP